MVQLLACICPSSFQLDWHAANTHLTALLCRIKLEKVKQSILHMNCFRMKKCWTLKETHNPYKVGLEN